VQVFSVAKNLANVQFAAQGWSESAMAESLTLSRWRKGTPKQLYPCF